MTRVAGFIVFESCEEWEQPLRLRFGPGLPVRGILDWHGGEPITVFPDRKTAREAIARTEWYARATEKPDMFPRRAICTVRPISRPS